jgi:predicted DNA-binding transcriptional regulator AlpA
VTKYEILTTEQVARRIGIATSSLRTYRTRGRFIPPDGMLGKTPYWSSVRVDEWQKTQRRKRGRPTKKASTNA